MSAGLPYAGLRGRARDPFLDAVVDPALQRELEVVPLEVDRDGTVHVAAARPDVDLDRLGCPARLSIARRDELRTLLPPGGPGTPRPRRRRIATRRRIGAFVAVLGVAGAAAAAVVLLDPGGEAPSAAPPDVVVDASLPDAVRAALPGPVRPAPAAAAAGAVCAGRAVAAVVAAPAGDGGCGLAALGEATVAATVLFAPGGGCVDAQRARALAATAAPGRAPDRSRPLAVRAAAGRPCIAPDPVAVRTARYPLADVAVLLAAPRPGDRARIDALVRALGRVEEMAPVTQLVLSRAPG